jgi:LCP family protein required for cell wall assembly
MGLDRTVSDQDPNVVYPISRTDTLIAASFDPGSRHVYLLSIPRDTRAQIPKHGTDKINAAHAYGGAGLSLRTTQNFLGVAFPYYIELSARGLVHLIDAVGGVTIRIDRDLNYDDNWDGLHIHLKKGNRRLGGAGAMEYARFRHDALGDIGRIQRQQQLMNALMDELRRPRVIFRMGRILKVFQEDVTTNLEPDQLVSLAWFGIRLPKGGLVRETLPGGFGGYAGYWLPDQAKDRAIVADWFYGIAPETLAGATVEIVNATASQDAAADPAARLQALGLRLLRVSPAPDAAETIVIVHKGDPALGQVVAAALGVRRVVMREDSNGADVAVVLGKDFAPLPAMVPFSRNGAAPQDGTVAPATR